MSTEIYSNKFDNCLLWNDPTGGQRLDVDATDKNIQDWLDEHSDENGDTPDGKQAWDALWQDSDQVDALYVWEPVPDALTILAQYRNTYLPATVSDLSGSNAEYHMVEVDEHLTANETDLTIQCWDNTMYYALGYSEPDYGVDSADIYHAMMVRDIASDADGIDCTGDALNDEWVTVTIESRTVRTAIVCPLNGWAD